MEQDKRKGEQALPDNIKDYLTTEQLNCLHRIESFGWQLRFIRRPLFQKATAVVVNPEGTSIGILEEDGRVNLETDIVIRD